jgi:hypothetical protein
MELGRASGCGLSVGVIGGASTVKDIAHASDVMISDLTKLNKVLQQYSCQKWR